MPQSEAERIAYENSIAKRQAEEIAAARESVAERDARHQAEIAAAAAANPADAGANPRR